MFANGQSEPGRVMSNAVDARGFGTSDNYSPNTDHHFNHWNCLLKI